MPLSYGCMPNIKKNIESHNRRLLNKKKTTDESCNWINKKKCPLKGDNFRAENVIYKVPVSTKNEIKLYIRLMAN